MEGQDVARPETARDITDSSVEQGLEAELSVDLDTKVAPATATSDSRGSTLSEPLIRGSGIPTTPARATDWRRGHRVLGRDRDSTRLDFGRACWIGSNDKGATAAVTRYGYGRGESFEG